MKKVRTLFVVLAAMVVVLSGCTMSQSSVTPVTTSTDSSKVAEKILQSLDFSDDLTEVKQRVILGKIFASDSDAYYDATYYECEDEGTADAVGVFFTEDMEKCQEYINTYLDSRKNEIQRSYRKEVFKISNAVVVSNDNELILIICSDIEKAKTIANELLG